MNEAMQTPITDLLARVPTDACLSYEHCPTHHQHIPFGRLAAEALAEISRLTSELDEAKKTKAEYSAVANNLLGQVTEMKALLIETVESENGLLSRCSALEARLAWHKVKDGMPTEHGRYALWSPTLGASGCIDFDGTNYWSHDAIWLGPLPAAPNEAEQT